MSLRGQSEKQVADARILGDGEFVQGVMSEMDALGKANLRAPRLKKDLKVLAQKV